MKPKSCNLNVLPDSAIIVASSTMSLWMLHNNRLNTANNYWLISLNPKAQYLSQQFTQMLICDLPIKAILNPKKMREIKSFIKKTRCSNAIFYDFSQDIGTLLLAHVCLKLGLNISVIPAAPIPKYKVSLLSALLNQSIDIRRAILFKILHLFSIPVGLYSYGNPILHLKSPPHFRLCSPKITFSKYNGVSPSDSLSAPPENIRFLYIEGCEYLLSRENQSYTFSVICSISEYLNSLGYILYIKPRPYNSIYSHIPLATMPFYTTHLPCEQLDLSKLFLFTIASFGALSSFRSTVFSISLVLIHAMTNKRDLGTIDCQYAYANAFNHPKIYFPSSIPALNRLVSASLE